MSKKRMVDGKFWSDNFVRKINALDRYLFLYFLTNTHTNVSGVYELPLDLMSYETGIATGDLGKMLLTLNEKISYIDGWIIIKNFPRHQNHENVNISKGIARELMSLPENIFSILSNHYLIPSNVSKEMGKMEREKHMRVEDSYMTHEDSCMSPGELNLTLLNLTSLNLTPPAGGGTPLENSSPFGGENTASPLRVEEVNGKYPTLCCAPQNDDSVKSTEIGVSVNRVMKIFYAYNPAINFANKSLRLSAEELIRKFGEEETVKLSEIAVGIQGQEFAPTITNPTELKNKFGQLRSFIGRTETKTKNADENKSMTYREFLKTNPPKIKL